VERREREEVEGRLGLLQTVIDELPSGVYLVRGRDARLVLANHAAAEVWGADWPRGQSMAEFLATSGTRICDADGRLLAPEHLATLRTLHTGEAVRQHQEVIRHPDGTTLPILLNAVPLDPRVLGRRPADMIHADEPLETVALVVLQDVSPFKEAERLKDEFIGIPAHELRNPMAALKGFADMLALQTARGKGPRLDDWQTEALDAIKQATTRLIELTDDLLDVTRLQGGRLDLRVEPSDLVSLTKRTVARLQIISERHTITVHAASEHVIAPVDARRIEQVITNLINNAIKYSPQGGDVAITVGEDREAGVAQICVRDHGIGIPAYQQAHIFGRFVRADNARDQGISGTGLGLYLCRGLVERHGGQIWFESREGQGTAFTFALPLAMDLDER
jgi:two-component system, OmpR family, phosphate regulon sensor histidine kinase PhoR